MAPFFLLPHVKVDGFLKRPQARRARFDRLTVTGTEPALSLSKGRMKRNAAFGLFKKP
jgi:hypothetical protein